LKAAVDTGVFVEFVDKRGPYHEAATAVVSSLGKLEIVLPSVVLTEICYVTARILEAAGRKDALDKAVELVKWLHSHPSVRIVDHLQLKIETARVKIKHKIALGDCYVLALSRLEGCKAVFRKREREMSREIEKEFDVIFLEDYSEDLGRA